MFWYSLFTTLSLFGTIVTGLFAWLAWRLRQRHTGAITCMVMLIAIGVWTGSYAMEQVTSALNTKIFWHKVSYFGIPIVPIAWFVFNLQINHLAQWRFRWWLGLLAVKPLLLWVIAWSPFANQIWSSYTLTTVVNYPTPILQVEYGPLFALHTGFAYVLFLAGTILYVRHLLRTMSQSPNYVLGLILCVLSPFVVNVLRVAGVSPFNLFDLTPIALSTLGATAAWYIFRFPLRDLLMLAQREVLAQIGDGVIVLDLQNRVTDLNAAAQTLLRKTEQEMLRQPVEALLPGSDLAIRRYLQRYRQTVDAETTPLPSGPTAKNVGAVPADGVEGGVERIVVNLKIKRPSIFNTRSFEYEMAHIEVSIFPLLAQHPFVNGCVLVLRDNTEKVRAEQHLQQVDRRYQNLVEMVPDAILVGTPSLSITNCNRRAAELYGVEKGTALFGLRLVDLLLEADVPRFLHNVYKMIGEDKNYSDIYALKRPDDTLVEVEMHMMLVRDRETMGVPVGFLAVMRNVTERLRQEETNNRMQKIESIGLLASGLSHDFNNLLTGMMTQGSIALKQSTPDGDVQRHVQQMMQMARHAASLSQQLAAYSGRELPEVEPIDLDGLAAECIELLAATLPSTIQLQARLQSAPFVAQADRRQLQLVVQNLVLKAVDALDARRAPLYETQTLHIYAYPQKLLGNQDPYDWFEGPPLTSHYEQDGDKILVRQTPLKAGRYLCLSVSGAVLEGEMEQSERLFNPDFTATSSGRGLGLSVLLGIARAHDGGLEVQHREDGHSVFRVYLPAVEASDISQANGASANPLPELAGTALVVDDDTIVRETLAEALTFLGMTTTEATNGREGVDLYMQRQPRFDIVLLDVKMPVMDGAEALAVLQEFDQQARVLLTSGYTGESNLEALLQRPTVQFLHKPYNLDELAVSIQSLLAL